MAQLPSDVTSNILRMALEAARSENERLRMGREDTFWKERLEEKLSEAFDLTVQPGIHERLNSTAPLTTGDLANIAVGEGLEMLCMEMM